MKPLQVAFAVLRCVGLFVFLAGQSWAEEPSAPERAPILLIQGEQRLLKIPGLLRYSLGGEAIRASAVPGRDERDQILIKGVRPGISDLWTWKKGGSTEHRTVQVGVADREPLRPALARALGRLDEAEVIFSGSGVILRGEITGLPELGRIQALARGFPQEVQDETLCSEALLNRGKTQLESWLRSSPYRDRLEVELSDRSLVLRLVEGSINGPAEKTRIEKHARGIFPAVSLEIDALPDTSPTVHFKVFLLELHRDRFRSLGLTWPAVQESAFRVTTSSIQNLVQLDVALQALENEGSVRVLSNPELVVRAPGEAELFSGGELPIETQGAYFSNVTWKNFGLLLKLKVDRSAGDRVRLDILTEVSHLDSTLKLNKIPGLQSNRMKTQVDARYGVPLLLSGLLQQGTRRQARGLPFLRDIPILGALFGSEDYLNEKSELVAILLPSREPPQPPMERVQTRRPQEVAIPSAEPPEREIPALPAPPRKARLPRQSPALPRSALR